MMNAEVRRAHNDALIKVMSTQFKKNAKAEHELVESYGYIIYKYDGSFRIRNDKTCKIISLRYTGSYRYSWVLDYGDTYADVKRVKSLEELKVVDLVGIREKPRNSVYKALQWGHVDDIHAKYSDLRESLRHAKWNVKYHTDRVVEIQRKMLTLQNELLAESKKLAKYSVALEACKKEIGIA